MAQKHEPLTVPNVAHYPDHKCRVCGNNRFTAHVIIKYDPLSPMSKYIVPVYECSRCGELLDLVVNVKKHQG